MQKNLYYRAVLRRSNVIKEAILNFCLSLASSPRLLLEVFIRKNFGERYFRFSTVIILTIVLAIIPPLLKKFFEPAFSQMSEAAYYQNGLEPVRKPASPLSMSHFILWYVYLAAFVYVGYLRRLEIKRNPSVFDFAKYSLFSGKINPLFAAVPIGGKKPSVRFIETVLEPAFFFIIGLVLFLIHQHLGILLLICSIIYSGSYFASYHIGDNFVMDKIDEMIVNAELKKSFVDDLKEDETRGFRFIGRKPADPEKRKEMLPMMIEDDEVFEAQ